MKSIDSAAWVTLWEREKQILKNLVLASKSHCSEPGKAGMMFTNLKGSSLRYPLTMKMGTGGCAGKLYLEMQKIV